MIQTLTFLVLLVTVAFLTGTSKGRAMRWAHNAVIVAIVIYFMATVLLAMDALSPLAVPEWLK